MIENKRNACLLHPRPGLRLSLIAIPGFRANRAFPSPLMWPYRDTEQNFGFVHIFAHRVSPMYSPTSTTANSALSKPILLPVGGVAGNLNMWVFCERIIVVSSLRSDVPDDKKSQGNIKRPGHFRHLPS